jgi:hypothetical protein
MKDRDERTSEEQTAAVDLGSAADENVTRAESQGESDEPNAPTAEEENAGMNTVLSAEPLSGVQDDASDG